ncbi:unnamed protein product [Calypogeia fissa]
MNCCHITVVPRFTLVVALNSHQYLPEALCHGLLSRFVIREVAVRKTDHDHTIEKEKAAREAKGKNVEARPPKTKPLGLQSKTKPKTLSPPRHLEAKAVATPPEQPVGSSEAVEARVEEPTGNDDARPALSGHSDVNLDPTGIIDRLTEEAKA